VTEQDIHLKAADGHQLGAFVAEPDSRARGSIVVLQEIFGVTAHIREVARQFAAQGYLAIAPALFDRVEAGAVLGYDEMARGRSIMEQLSLEQTITDVAAATEHGRHTGAVGVVGYCWGGGIADLAACRLELAAAVSYYGGRTAGWLNEQPRCPVMYHFGGQDPLIPPELVEQIRAGRPAGIFHLYPDAGHGFNCTDRSHYHPASAALAQQRTLDFLTRHLQA